MSRTSVWSGKKYRKNEKGEDYISFFLLLASSVLGAFSIIGFILVYLALGYTLLVLSIAIFIAGAERSIRKRNLNSNRKSKKAEKKLKRSVKRK